MSITSSSFLLLPKRLLFFLNMSSIGKRLIIKRFAIIDMRLMIKAPHNAAPIVDTSKPGMSLATNKSNRALIIHIPKPNVIKINGSVNRINKGFKMTLSKLSVMATRTSVPKVE